MSTRREWSPRPSVEDIVQEFEDVVYATFVGLGWDRDLAADLTQETFLRIFSSIEGYRGKGIAAWVMTITRSVHQNHLRTMNAKKRKGQMVDLEAVRATRADRDHVGAVETKIALQRALGRLPRRQRHAVLLQHRGWSYTEIGDFLDIGPSQVREVLRHGRRTLRKELDDD